MKRILSLLLASALAATGVRAQGHTLWYDRPAMTWTQALPVGNGRLGGMVFGNPAVERVQLNEETIWAGQPNFTLNPRAKGALPRVRSLIAEGKYREAQNLADASIMPGANRNSGMPYQTFGDLYISMPGHGSYTGYRRELSLDSALSVVSYTVGGVSYRRETIATLGPGDNVVAVRLTASKPGMITFTACLTSPHHDVITRSEGGEVTLSGVTSRHEGLKSLVRFQGRMAADVSGGTVTSSGGVISVSGADEAVVYVSIATNVKSYDDVSADEQERTRNGLRAAMAKGYAALREAHLGVFTGYMGRVKLDLGPDRFPSVPTDRRIADFAATADQTVTFEANTALTSLRLVVEGEGAWTLNELTASRLPSTATPVMNDTMAEYESYTLDKVTDGNTGTYAHLKNVESNNIRQGDWVGVTFEPSKRVGKVTFVQEGNGDCIAKGEISYQGEDGEWYKIGDVDASGTQTFEFPNVNVKAIRVTNLENTSKWWKVYEITAEEGVESPAGAIVNNDSSIALSGVANETSATITGGEVTFEPGAYAAIDLASLRTDIAISQETIDALAGSGLTLVYSTNGLGWNAVEDGHVDSARYVGVRNETDEAVTFDFSAAPISLTFSAVSGAFVSTSEAVEGAETDKMLDGSLTTYWRPVDEQGTLTYLVSDPLVDGLPRDGARILSWGEPSGASVSAKVYTSDDYSTTQVVELGTLEHSITDLSFSEAVKAAGAEFYGVESISISWDGTVPSIAEVSMLDATYEPPVEPEPGVDKSELKAAVDAAAQLVEGDYTAESWAPFAEALTAAEGVLADEDATAADVASALDALKTAQAGLVEVPEEPEVSYDELKAAIEAAGALAEDDYTPSSWAALADALAAAQDALASTDQEVVDGATAALSDAMSALVERADTSALSDAIDAAVALDTTGKTEESVAALNEAVEAAREVLANAEATQDVVDAATQAIADAIAGLEDVEAPAVDTSKLAEAVADALTLKEADYTADSWAALVDAREAAEAVLANADATQDEVDDALAALEAARAALVEDTTEPGGEPGEEPGEEPGDKPGDKPGEEPGGSQQPGGSTKPGGTVKPGSDEEVPQTGDPSSLATAAVAGAAGVATVAAALVASRKVRRS